MKGYFTGKPIPTNNLERYDYFRNRIKLRSSWDSFVWKDRLNNIAGVEKLRHEALRIRKPLLKRWRKIYKTVHPLMHIQGTVDGQRYYLDAGGEGVSFQSIDEKYFRDGDEIKFALDEDLPIYVGQEDKLSERDRELLKARLKGPKESKNRYAVEAQVRDDLITEYRYLEGRFNTLNKMVGLCNTLIKKYIDSKYHDFYHKYKYEDVLIDLKLNGRDYTFLFKFRGGFEFVRFPESAHYTDDGDMGEFIPKPELYNIKGATWVK